MSNLPYIIPGRQPQKQRVPQPRPGQIEYLWDAGLSESVVCHLSYEPADRGASEPGTGMQLSPEYPAQMTLYAAYLRGLDIYMMLSDAQIEDIEIAALDDLQRDSE